MKTNFREYVQSTPDFPKPGVVYWDFTPILIQPDVRKRAIQEIKHHFEKKNFTHIACIEAKGFIFGSMLAQEMNLPMVLIRKPGLTPGLVYTKDFVKEYGVATYEMAKNRLAKGDKVLVVYDILAGPGATLAAVDLVKQSGADVLGCAYAVELEYLSARKMLDGLDIYSLVNIRDKHEI